LAIFDFYAARWLDFIVLSAHYKYVMMMMTMMMM